MAQSFYQDRVKNDQLFVMADLSYTVSPKGMISALKMCDDDRKR